MDIQNILMNRRLPAESAWCVARIGWDRWLPGR